MPDFTFVVSDGTSKRPSASTRSHAVKTGLQHKSQAIDPGGSKDSQLTIRQKDTLKGRFRVSNGPRKSQQVSNKEKQAAKASKLKTVQSRSTKDFANSSGHVTADHLDAGTYPNTPWDLFKAPGQGRGDPFSAFPIPLSDNDDKLIRFCTSTQGQTVALY